MNYLSAEQILFIHDRVIRETSGAHGVRDLSGLLSAIGRPQATFEGEELYPNILSKAAALIESLIGNHPFVDGNKRTGMVAAGVFLLVNGYRLEAGQQELVDFALAISTREITFTQIAGWFQDHTQSKWYNSST